MSTGQINWRVVGDVGGTNARFALVKDGGMPETEQVLSCADFDDLGSALAWYLKHANVDSALEAAIAVATAVTGDQIKFTNNHWSFSIEETRQRLGLQRLQLLNDFTALAMSLPHLQANELRQVGRGQAVPAAAIAVLGPGTGLGVSGLIPNGRGGWIPIAGEGGHVTCAGATERELDILKIAKQCAPHISTERLISGFGLPTLYWAVAKLQGVEPQDLDAAQIGERGVAGSCPVCRETMEVFCSMLGTAAGNLALTLGARGGVYIGGGIVPKLGDFFTQSKFRERFESKGRFVDYMSAIPTFVIEAKYPALVGAAQAFAA